MMCRSCVEPKLVSNGWRSRIRSSRISICLINTRCSRDEEILTPLILPLEIRYEVIVLEIFQELLAHTQLHVLRGLEALLLERLNVGGNEHAPHVAFNLDAG